MTVVPLGACLLCCVLVSAVTGQTQPTRNATAYRLTYRQPTGCDPDTTCDIFVGIDTNEGSAAHLDIYLVGKAKGWVAVGFSTTPTMDASDVLGCSTQVSDLSKVLVVDTYNPGYYNTPDDSETKGTVTDVTPFITEYKDEIIKCVFSRKIKGQDPSPQDLELSQNLFLEFGRGSTGRSSDKPEKFSYHDLGTPAISSVMFNPANSTAEISETKEARIQGEPTAPTRSPSDYRLIYREPSGCVPPSCDIFVGIDTNMENPSFLDIYLVGKTAGWVAVGFSNTSDMFLTDVIGCSTRASDLTQVLVIDTYNPAKPNKYNVLDDSEESGTLPSDIVAFVTKNENGRLTCVFSRKIVGQDPVPQDLVLNQDLFFEFGRGSSGRGSAKVEKFSYHDLGTPIISGEKYNPQQDKKEIGVTREVVVVEETDGNPTPPTRNASDYRLIYRSPSGCEPHNCDYFAGIDTNDGDPSFLDIYLVGKATGWVAIGFTKTVDMFKADVVGCSVDKVEHKVMALDTFNPADDKTNTIDDSEEASNGEAPDMVTYYTDYSDDIIICVFSREIEGVDPCPQDMLLNQSFYFQFGRSTKPRDTVNASNFHYHDLGTPVISKKRYNPSSSYGEVGVDELRSKLIVVHGVLMLVAWPLLTFIAVFFAAWMKPALPNGQWFQVHRAFNFAGLLIAVVGFIVVFVAHKDQPTPGLVDLGAQNKIGTAHFACGILIMALQIINPLLSLFRCKPTEKLRWIYNVVHGLIIGYGAMILAYVSMGLGIYIYERDLTDYTDNTIFWVYTALAIFSILTIIVLFLTFTVEALVCKKNARRIAPSLVSMLLKLCNTYAELDSNETKMELEDSTRKSETTADSSNLLSSSPSSPSPPKKPSADAPIRWAALVLSCTVIFGSVFAVIILMITRSNVV